MFSSFRVSAIATALAEQVRATGRAVAYSHPAHREVATGTGPCRHCLGTFRVAEEERILFTHQPFSDPAALPVPGPVFIHARECPRYEGDAFPDSLRSLPLALDAFGERGLPRAQVRIDDGRVEVAIENLLADREVRYLHLRHGEAGCFIARVDRAGW